MVLPIDLEACKERLGPPGAAREKWVARLPRARAPRWVRGDPLRRFFDEHGDVLREGRVAWAALVQANQALFVPSRSGDAPGDIVHPLADDGDPAELSACGAALFELRSRDAVPEALRPIERHLNDEQERVFGLAIPSEVGPPTPAALTTTMFIRAWLPQRVLAHRVFPVVLPPPGLTAVVPLPEAAWPPCLIEMWGSVRGAG